MANKTFKVEARTKKPITFDLESPDGEVVTFKFTPPKTAGMTLNLVSANGNADVAMLREGLDWLGQGLSDDQGQLLLDRLKDPEDDLDLDTVGEVIRWLLEQATGRPTGRQSN